MSNKDLNIHVKTPGADESARKLDKVGKAGKQVGEDVAAGSKTAATETEKSSKKLTGMGGILNTLKGQVTGMLGAWLGLQGVQKLIDYLIRQLEKVKQYQEEIYQKSLKMASVGQALEIQTGTIGQQRLWTKKALEMQKAGGLSDVGTAKEMMIAMDIAFSKQGGIKNDQVLNLGKSLAPFVGANQMSGEEVTKLFEFAGIAGIAPTEAAYKQYFAQLQSGYTSSKVTKFGSFMDGLQKGATPYLGAGGTLPEAISTYASARSVSSNEAFAATLLEQLSRFSSGAYEKPRQAVEASQHVRWENLSMDQRKNALLQHVASIPANVRTQTLVEQGFEPGLASEIQKLVSSEAVATMSSTRKGVYSASAALTDQQMQAYLNSDLAKAAQTEAEIASMQVEAGPDYAAWQRRIGRAKEKHKILAAKGEDSIVKDELEPYVMALDEMIQQGDDMLAGLPEGEQRSQVKSFLSRARSLRSVLSTPGFNMVHNAGTANRGGLAIEKELAEVSESVSQYKQQQPTPSTIINYNTNTIYNPKVGPTDQGPRFTQD